MPNVETLVRQFGSAVAVAEAAGVHKSAVTRWKQRGYAISPKSQRGIMKEARKLGLDEDRIAKAVGMPWCPTCRQYHY
jgi:hypothetical protein